MTKGRLLLVPLVMCSVALLARPEVTKSAEPAATKPGITGVWRVLESTVEGEAAHKAQPGLYIFTDKHYSIVHVTGNQPRPVLTNLAKATPVELLGVYGDVFQAQAGTYELAGTTLTLRPMVAKNPSVMSQGQYMEYDLVRNGDNLTLSWLTANGKSIPSPVSYKLARAE